MKKEQVLVNPEEVVKAFNEADDNGKRILSKFFSPLLPKKITDIIKSYEDACDYNKHAKALPDLSMLPVKNQKYILASIMLPEIIEALNEGWVPNWESGNNQSKYIIWFNMPKSDFGFDGVYDLRYYADSIVPSRLCFKSEELAKYCFAQFKELWKNYMLYVK